MNHQINKTILIVCEGESTEPSYFESIRDIIVDKKIDVRISISPMPKNEKKEEFKLREGAKKRELKKLDEEKEKTLKKYEVEEEYIAQPVRYVREAQMGLEDGSFDEVWAVFDKDGHPKQKEAFELSEKKINTKKVNIAFNSISFEHWVLLHFERNSKAFNKSQCREGKEKYDCGLNTNPKDCHGVLCVCGYMITQGFFQEDLDRKIFLFSELPNCLIAIDNAIWLRNLIIGANHNQPIYELNPFTTIYRLAFRLINLPIDFNWFDRANECDDQNISFKINRNANILSINIKKIREGRYILLKGSFGLINSNGGFYPFGDRTVLDNDEKVIEFDLGIVQDFVPLFIGYKIRENEFLFSDL